MILSPVFAGARGGAGDGPVVPPDVNRPTADNSTVRADSTLLTADMEPA